MDEQVKMFTSPQARRHNSGKRKKSTSDLNRRNHMTESLSEASAAASAATPQISVSVQIASDLHLEFFASNLDEAGREAKFSELIKPAAPILALLGDIGVLGTPGTTAEQDGTKIPKLTTYGVHQ